MFTLKKQHAKVSHINTREEKHGDEPVLAIDIGLQMDVGAEFLDALEPGLRGAFYGATEDDDGPPTKLLYAALGPLTWACNMKDASLEFHARAKADQLQFTVSVKKLKLELLAGGTVSAHFHAQTNPTPDQVGRLSAKLGDMVSISVVPSDLFAGGGASEAKGDDNGED